MIAYTVQPAVGPTPFLRQPRQEVDALDAMLAEEEEPTVPPPYRYRPSGGRPEGPLTQ